MSLGLPPSIAQADGLDLDLAHSLIMQGKSTEALTLLEPYEFEQAGDTKFDYLLGLAALNSGRPDKASLILERVLAVDPLHAAARVDLGRAYLLLGDTKRAHAEFTHALTLNPPPPALAAIRQYLGEIELINKKPPTRFSRYFEAGAGYNNNVNNSTSQSQIIVPALFNLQLALNSANVKTADGYLGLAAGVEAIHPLSANWSVYTGMDMHSRNGLKYSNFDFVTLDGRVGASFNRNAEQIKGGLVAGRFDLGGAANRKSQGLHAEWRHTYNAANQTVLFGQYILYRYPNPTLASNNINQTIAGLGWGRTIANGRATIFSSFFGGNEHDTKFRADGSKAIRGVRLSGQMPIAEKLEAFASGGVQWGKYNRPNSTFLIVREDRQVDCTVGLIYHYSPEWMLRPQITLIQNQSNIVVNQYGQADFSLTLRRAF